MPKALKPVLVASGSRFFAACVDGGSECVEVEAIEWLTSCEAKVRDLDPDCS